MHSMIAIVAIVAIVAITAGCMRSNSKGNKP